MAVDIKISPSLIKGPEAQGTPKKFRSEGHNIPAIKDGVLRPTEDKAMIVPYSQVKKGFSDLAVVCDGVGGNGSGAIAADVGVQIINKVLVDGHSGVVDSLTLAALMKTALESAHVEIKNQQAMGNGRAKMATTATVAGWVIENGVAKAVVAWAGNSRVYLQWKMPDGKWREQVATCDDGDKVDYLRNQKKMSSTQAMNFLRRTETEPESSFAGNRDEMEAYFVAAKSVFKNVTTNTLGNQKELNVHIDILALPVGATEYWLSVESDGSACLTATERIEVFSRGGARLVAVGAREKAIRLEKAKSKDETEASGGSYLDDIMVVVPGFE